MAGPTLVASRSSNSNSSNGSNGSSTPAAAVPASAEATAAASPEICSFFVAGRCRFGDRCRNRHPADAAPAAATASGSPSTSPNSRRRRRQAAAEAEAVETNPMPPTGKAQKTKLRTSNDVIARLLWDDCVDTQWVSVGYLDRFRGMLEEPFDLFQWGEGLELCEREDELSIPQHRIYYFTYRGHTLWDRRSREDHVFANERLPAFVARIDAEMLRQAAAEAEEAEEAEEEAVAAEVPAEQPSAGHPSDAAPHDGDADPTSNTTTTTTTAASSSSSSHSHSSGAAHPAAPRAGGAKAEHDASAPAAAVAADHDSAPTAPGSDALRVLLPLPHQVASTMAEAAQAAGEAPAATTGMPQRRKRRRETRAGRRGGVGFGEEAALARSLL